MSYQIMKLWNSQHNICKKKVNVCLLETLYYNLLTKVRYAGQWYGVQIFSQNNPIISFSKQFSELIKLLLVLFREASPCFCQPGKYNGKINKITSVHSKPFNTLVMHQFTQTLSTSNIGNSFDKCIQIIAYAQVKIFKDNRLLL